MKYLSADSYCSKPIMFELLVKYQSESYGFRFDLYNKTDDRTGGVVCSNISREDLTKIRDLINGELENNPAPPPEIWSQWVAIKSDGSWHRVIPNTRDRAMGVCRANIGNYTGLAELSHEGLRNYEAIR